LGRQCLNFEQLTPPEQELWSLFENSDIYEFLTGQKDTVPEFENYLTFSVNPSVKINIQRIAQNLHPDFSHTTTRTDSKGSIIPFTGDTLLKRKEGKNRLQSHPPRPAN
jgi:hypothetical protein